MKITLLLSLLLTSASFAEFATWTSKDGKSAELELVSVTTIGTEKSGVFKTKAGKTVNLLASQLSEADGKRLADWKPEAGTPAAAATAEGASVYDKVLDGNLVKLDGKSLKKFKETAKPTKYYLFYYTASWCGPCQKFTPSLVEFYNKYKPDHPEFELVLITHDSDEADQEKYTVDKQMPWPQLKLGKVEKFEKEFKHPGSGIPNLVLTDLQGNLLKTSYVGKEYQGPGVVMSHLESLLK